MNVLINTYNDDIYTYIHTYIYIYKFIYIYIYIYSLKTFYGKRQGI